MNAALVVTSVAGYFSARRSSGEISRTAAGVLLHAVRRDFRHSSAAPEEVIRLAVEDMEPQGLRYLGVYTADGKEFISAGERLGTITDADRPSSKRGRTIRSVDNPWSIRIAARVPG